MAKDIFQNVINVQSIVKLSDTAINKLIDELEKEPAVNFTTSLPLSFRDKLKKKSIKEKVSIKDLIISALITKYPDLR